MKVCPNCNRPIQEDSEFCPIGGVRVKKVDREGTVDVTATPEDIKDCQRDELVFTYFGLAFFVLGITSMLIHVAGWCTVLCFIGLAFFLAVVLYSHRKVADLRGQLREWYPTATIKLLTQGDSLGSSESRP